MRTWAGGGELGLALPPGRAPRSPEAPQPGRVIPGTNVKKINK